MHYLLAQSGNLDHEQFVRTFAATLIAVVVLAAATGWIARRKAGDANFINRLLGIFIDDRDRYSLNHFQVVLWTFFVLSGFVTLFVCDGYQVPKIPTTLLWLLGISVSSTVASAAVKSNKEVSGAVIARGPCAMNANVPLGAMPRAVTGKPPSIFQIFMEEEGEMADKTISITKFQNFVFTVVAVAAVGIIFFETRAFPELDSEGQGNLLWLIATSHAGYIGGKIPNKK